MYILFSLLTKYTSRSSVSRGGGGTRIARDGVGGGAPRRLASGSLFNGRAALTMSRRSVRTTLSKSRFHIPLGSPMVLIRSNGHTPRAVVRRRVQGCCAISAFSNVPSERGPLAYGGGGSGGRGRSITDTRGVG